ncbi:hypothetical protein AB0M46_15050 [Dactylosporangium sp. NPDC051485]
MRKKRAQNAEVAHRRGVDGVIGLAERRLAAVLADRLGDGM